MPITRSFQNAFEVTDWTQELLIVPNNWGLVNSLGIFENQGVSQNTITLEKITQDGTVIVDKVRGERPVYGKDYTRQEYAFPIPHFPMDDFILPSDVQGKRAYGSPDQAETLAAVRARKLERIRRAHAWTLEAARVYTIVNGKIYNPSSTVGGTGSPNDFYNQLGSTSQQTVDFDLEVATTNIMGKCNDVIKLIQDGVGNGGFISGVTALVGSTFFDDLVNHPKVREAYMYYTSVEEPLRRRQGGDTTLYRRFSFGGIDFIEYRGSYTGASPSPMIGAADAYFFPTGVEDMFVTFFAPANKFEFVNTMGEQAYVFEYASEKGDKIELQSESNFLNVIRRPNGVVKGVRT